MTKWAESMTFAGALNRADFINFHLLIVGEICGRCGKAMKDGEEHRAFRPASPTNMAYLTQESFCSVCLKVEEP